MEDQEVDQTTQTCEGVEVDQISLNSEASLRKRRSSLELDGREREYQEDVSDQLTNASPATQLYVKIGYAIGETGCYIISSIEGFYVSSFLLEVAQVPTLQAGAIILIADAFDAFTDPLVGKASDDTRSPYGRRRPWLFFGSFILCIFFWMAFMVPPISGWYLFAYYILVGLIMKFGYASVAVPYTALTPEITSDYDQRTSLTMWRMVFGMIGSVVATVGHGFLIQILKTTNENGSSDMQRAYFLSIGLWCFIAWACIMITVVVIKETIPKGLLPSASILNLLRESRDALLTKEFLSVVVMYSSSWIAINFLQGNLFLWGKYVLQEEAKFTIFLIIIQCTATISLFGWGAISKKFGKKPTAYAGLAFFIPTCICFVLADAHQLLLAGFASLCGGLGVGCMLLMPWAMLPDVMELDEIRCGYRREGVFYSWFVFFQKIGLGLSLGISSLVLGWAGYISPSDQDIDESQPDSVLLALRGMMGIVPIFLFLITFIAIYLFPITKQSHSQVTQEVLRKRKEKLEASEADTAAEEDGEINIEMEVL